VISVENQMVQDKELILRISMSVEILRDRDTMSCKNVMLIVKNSMEVALLDIIGKMISTMKFVVMARLTVLVQKIYSTLVRDNIRSLIQKKIWREESTKKSERLLEVS